MNRSAVSSTSRSVTTARLNGLQVLQIEANVGIGSPAKSPTTTKVPVPIVVVGAADIEKVPAGRVLDGDFAV